MLFLWHDLDGGSIVDTLSLDYNFLLAEAVGEEHGIKESDLDFVRKRAGRFSREISKKRKAGDLAFMKLPYDRPTQEKIAKVAEDLRSNFRNMVVLGIGGSALGASALFQALKPWVYNIYPIKSYPRLFILDNIDPRYIAEVVEVLDPRETSVCVVSKSGSTTETLAQYIFFKKWIKDICGDDYKKHFIFITDPEKGPLREIANRDGLLTFPVPQGVGGRFSVLSSVGLFPAACVGIDIHAVCEGAAHMDEICRVDVMDENPALMYAALMFLMVTRKRKPIHVVFCYSNKLYGLADWYRQLLAESLGKRFDEDGKEVRVGPTPVKALGVTDQHSQVQLYVEGPNDKVFTFLKVDDYDSPLMVPEGVEDHEALKFLERHTFGEIMEAERVGTEYALKKEQRPSCTINFPRISPYTIGQFFILMELAVTVMGRYFKVNPFNQPGVEAGKIAAFAMLGRPGFQEKREEIISQLEKDLSFRI